GQAAHATAEGPAVVMINPRASAPRTADWIVISCVPLRSEPRRRCAGERANLRGRNDPSQRNSAKIDRDTGSRDASTRVAMADGRVTVEGPTLPGFGIRHAGEGGVRVEVELGE